MFNKIKEFIFGQNHIKIQGLNLDRAIAKALKAGIVITRAQRVSHREYRCALSDRMLKKLIVTLDPLCYNIQIEKSIGLSALIKALKVRWGLIAGLACAVILINIYGMRVWDIKINGAQTISEQEILTVLEQNGIYAGAPKSKIDRRAAADAVIKDVEAVSLASIEIKGTGVIVNIKERITAPTASDETNYGSDIVASTDCVIIGIAPLSGTPVVKRGDIVRKGEVLIAGYEERYEGSTLLKDPVRADGIVWGEVNYVLTRYFSLERVEYKPTGKTKTVTLTTVSGKLLFGRDELPDYKHYNTIRQTSGTMYLLPIRFERIVYCELEPKRIILDPEDVIPQYSRDLLSEAAMTVPKAAQVLNSYTHITMLEKSVRIDAIIKTKEIISTRIKI